MATALDLQSLEHYCETLYNPSSQASRLQVESLLNYHFPTFSALASTTTQSPTSPTFPETDLANGHHSPAINSPIESALFCRNLLVNTNNPYALMQVSFSSFFSFSLFFSFVYSASFRWEIETERYIRSLCDEGLALKRKKRFADLVWPWCVLVGVLPTFGEQIISTTSNRITISPLALSLIIESTSITHKKKKD